MLTKRSTSSGEISWGQTALLAVWLAVAMAVVYVWLLNSDFSTAPEFVYSQF